MSTVVDASVVIAWQTPDHQFFDQAGRLVGRAEPPLYLNELNLAEVLVGLAPQTWPDATALLTTMGFEFVTTSAVEVARARLDTRLRMPDACVLATARKVGARAVLTFDAALAEAARRDGFVTELSDPR